MTMTDPRASYAHRFARVAIRRPRRPMTEAEWEAWVATLDEFGQTMARLARALTRAFPRPVTTSPRAIAIIMRPHR
jgi:hypothetical protein